MWIGLCVVAYCFDECMIVCIIASVCVEGVRVFVLLCTHWSHIYYTCFSLKPMKSWLTGYGHFDDINEIMLINEINININVHKTLTLEYAALN